MGVPNIQTERFVVTIPPPEAAPRLLAFALENREHLAPWEPTHPEGFFVESYWAERLERNRIEFEQDLSLRMCILNADDRHGPIVGHANFSNIVRGAFQACFLGYSLDYRWVGKGAMHEALRGAIAHVFGTLGLHRVMANYMPTNERSGRVLRRLGFVVEGYARDYLFINGAWRDHVLTALTSPTAPPPKDSDGGGLADRAGEL